MVERVALITGCGKLDGIGAACSRALAAAGATVVVSSVPRNDARGASGLQELVDEIVAAGGKASAVFGDVSIEEDAAEMVAETVRRHGRLDILVNSAAAPKGKDRAGIEEVPLDAWHKQMAVNATGVFLMCRAAVTPMRKQGWGRIISISSIAAKIGGKNTAVYSATKAAVSGFTRALAVEIGPYGITANAICPFAVVTSRARASAIESVGDDPVALDAFFAEKAKKIPVRRVARPDEVGAMVAYLASEMSGFVTGQSFSICGGTT
jgi:NAD(P)-dependent dehydrogenase (short-subunit alcohol dehydrogenase family)